MQSKSWKVTFGSVAPVHDALRTLIERSDGALFIDRGRIQLQVSGNQIAEIAVTDPDAWAEIAETLGFKP